MSDQHMNASTQGTQPDSGSAPNDQVVADAAGGKNKGVPSGSGSKPQGQTPPIADENSGHGWDNAGRDNIQSVKD